MSGNCTSSSFSRLARKLMSSESSSQMCMFGSELLRRSKRAMLRAGGKFSELMELTETAGDAFSDSFPIIAFFLTFLPPEDFHNVLSPCKPNYFSLTTAQGWKRSQISGLFDGPTRYSKVGLLKGISHECNSEHRIIQQNTYRCCKIHFASVNSENVILAEK